MSDEQTKQENTGGCGCAGAQESAGEPGYEHMMPKVTFSTFILSLSSSALVQLGEVPEPETGQIMKNLPMAKHTIDILVMLQEKTTKCLNEEERTLLDGVLYELRMKYVVNSK